MATLRIAAWNVAWFTRLFDDRDRLADDAGWSGMPGVTRQRQAMAVATVLAAVDADIFAIVEAPDTGTRRSTVRALEGFAARAGLRQSRAMIGFPSGTEQEIALLYDPRRIAAHHDPMGEPWAEGEMPEGMLDEPPRFDGVFPMDLDGDGRPDPHRFSKPPLEAAVRDLATGRAFRLIAVHAKSKAPHGAASPADAMRIALRNRRRQLAQCAWIRARIESHIARGDEVVALGDFNDGPGLDTLERVFGRSGVEIVIGSADRPETHLRSNTGGETAMFRAARGPVEALVDFVMLSPRLAEATRPVWRVWHPIQDPETAADPALAAALLEASDHFPVTADLGG